MQPKPLLLVIFSFTMLTALSQVSKSLVSTKFKVPKISRAQAHIVCPVGTKSAYPYNAIGVKLGDPFAFTYKLYPKKNWAFSIDMGKASSSLYNRYFRNSLNQLIPDSVRLNPAFRYVGHHIVYDWVAQAKFLYQIDASKISKGMRLYTGLGWQWRATKINYDYLVETTSYRISEKRFPQGPLVNVGFEYSNFYWPISAFIEMEWVTDISFDKGYNRMQGGVGLRYVF